MASTQGEIRVGPSHQARLPDFRSGVASTEVSELSSCPDLEHGREDLRWVPAMTLDTDLLMYLRAARSMAAFAGMCDGGSPDDGCIAASRDDTTINALDVLHDAGYDPGKALQALVKCPVPKGIDKKWSEEETKRFVKGLRQFGKNFFRIRKDLLPHKDTSELVEFYYLWKKTPGANNNRPHRRNRRQGSLRRIRNTRNTRGGNNQPKEVDATSPVTTSTGSTSSSSPSSTSRPSPNCKDPGEVSSGSEEENSEDENSDSRDNSSLRCQHCLTSSTREWQSSGKERNQLCSCNKKYNELPLGTNTVVVNNNLTQGRGEAPYLFRPVQNVENAEDSSGRMRTRTRAKEQTAGNHPRHGSGTDTPESEMDKKLCKSLASYASSPSVKNRKKSKSETPTKGRKRVQMELDNEDDKDVTMFKRRRNDTADSPAESLTTDSGSVVDDVDGGETNEQESEALENSSVSVVCSTSECSGINVFQTEYSSSVEKMHTLGSSMALPSITSTALSLVAPTLPQFTLPPPPPIQNLPSSVSISLPSPLLPSQTLNRLPSSLPLLPVIVVSAASHGTISNATGSCTTAAISNTATSTSVASDIRSRNINYSGNSAVGTDVTVTTVAGATNSAIVNSSSPCTVPSSNIPLAISTSSTDSDGVTIGVNTSKSIIILTTSASNVSSSREAVATTVSSTSVTGNGTAIINTALAMLSAVPPSSVSVSDGTDPNAVTISNSGKSPSSLLTSYPITTTSSSTIVCSATTTSTAPLPTTTFTTVADTSSDSNNVSSSITSVTTSIPNTVLSSVIVSDSAGTDGSYCCPATVSAMSIVNATTTVSGNINIIMPFSTSVITTTNSPTAMSIVSHSNAAIDTGAASSHTSIATCLSATTTMSAITTAALASTPDCSSSAHVSAACVSSTCPLTSAAIAPFATISFSPSSSSSSATMATSVNTCGTLVTPSAAATSAASSITTVSASGDANIGVKTTSPVNVIAAPVTTISSGIPTSASLFSTTVATTTTITLTTSLACPSTPISTCISSGVTTATLPSTSTFSTTTVTTVPANVAGTATSAATMITTSAISSGSGISNSDFISNNCSPVLENNDAAGVDCITTVIVTPTVGNVLSSMTTMDTNIQIPFLQEDLRVSGDIALRSSKSLKLGESEMHMRCGQVGGNVSNNTFEKVQNLDHMVHENSNGKPVTEEILRNSGELKQDFDRDLGNHSSEVSSLAIIQREDVKLERDDDFYCSKDILCRRKKDTGVLVKDREVSSFSDVSGNDSGKNNNNMKINKEETEVNDSILNRISVNLSLNDANSSMGSGSSAINVGLSNSSSLVKNGINNILPNHPHVTSIKVEPGLTSEEQLQHCNERDENAEINRSELLHSQRPNPPNISSIVGVSQNNPSIPGPSERSSPLSITNRTVPRTNATSSDIQPNSSGDLSLSKGTFLSSKYEEDDKISQLHNSINSSQALSDHISVHSNSGQSSVLSQGFNFVHSSSYHAHQRFGNSNGENSKNDINSNSSANCEMNQNEPQNLKIKQEVLPQSERQISSDPLQSLKEVKIPGYSTSNLPVSQPLTGSCSSTSQSSSSFSGDVRRSPANAESTNFLGPLVENIKKEPENFTCSDGNLGTSGTIATPSKVSSKLQPNVSDSFTSLHVSPLSRVSSNTPPMISSISTHISVTHSAVSLISPTRLTPTSLAAPGLSNSIAHPTQQNSPISRSSPGHPHPTPHPHPHPTPHPHSSPFIGPPSSHPVLHHHPHTLIHHSLFAAAAQAAAVHHNPYHPPHPYAPYSYPFPYHYGPLPQPHPLPHHSPPASVISSVSAPTSSLQQRHEQTKAERQSLDCSLSLNTSPAGPSRREITSDEIVSNVNQTNERHHSQEVGSPIVHHQSQHSSHHQNQGEKQVHSSSQTSNLQLQTSISAATSTSHKINSSLKCSSVGNRVSPTCHSTPIMSTAQPASTSVPLSLNNMHHSHGHHHQHIHHSPSIPAGANTVCVDTTPNTILNSSNPIASTNSRVHHSNTSHISSHSYHAKHSSHPVLMVQPPSLNQQGIGLNMPSSVPTSSLEALRAHAQAAASVQQQQQLQAQQQQIQCAQPLQNSGLQLAIMHSSPNSPVSVPGTHQLTSRHGQGYNDDVKVEPQLDIAETQQEEEVPSPSHVPRGPSPEPKIEDTECHRSQSAIFLRHWNRGDFNSCTRTDLTFKPVPDSKLARKREERLRKQAEKEREEREKVAVQAHSHKLSTPEKEGTKPPSRGPIETITSPYDRFTPRQGYDTPALRQLSEYARPHAGFSPGSLPRPSTLGLTPQCIDPLLHYQLNSMYAPGARERLELEHIEREKREREIRELRERELNDRLKDELIKTAGTGPRMANSLDPHWLDLQRRYAGLGTAGPAHQFGLYASPTAPSQTSLNQLERERLERLGIPTGPAGPHGPAAVGASGPHSAHTHPHAAHASSVAAAQAAQAQLEAAERLALATDPMVRLQMAGISPEYHAHTHAHTHAHSHTHLHLHPGQQAAQAQQAQQEAAAVAAGSAAFPLPASAGTGYPRPSLLPARDPAIGLHHPPELLGRGPGYADQLAHQLSAQAAHEQLQRQIMLERERFPHPHASLVAQHEEYIRQQREREMKVRALEEAARGSRP